MKSLLKIYEKIEENLYERKNMGILKDLGKGFNCLITGRFAEFREYRERVKFQKKNILMYQKNIEDSEKYFEKIKQVYPEGSSEYERAQKEVQRWKYNLMEARLEQRFARPNNKQDIKYRNYQCEKFPMILKKVISPDLDLRFHGTPIYFAEQIIKSGQITSSADRFDGYIKSTDLPGTFSVTNSETISRTIDCFADMVAYTRFMPAGCIFAVIPKKDKEDTELLPDTMHSVDFKKNPEQLFGIFTTHENIRIVRKWLKESGLNENLVSSFEDFIREVKTQSDMINESLSFDKSLEYHGDIKVPSQYKEEYGQTQKLERKESESELDI